MRITCYYGDYPEIGYIYLKPPKDEFDDYELSKNDIAKLVNLDQLNIPYVTDKKVASYLDQMTIASITFNADYEEGYDTEYGNDMDEHGNVFKPENVIYKLTEEEDSFIILQLEKPENLGYHYTEHQDRKPIALFKGLISARNDIYPLEYMMKPEFYFFKDVGLKFINDDLLCSFDALEIWESLSESNLEIIINSVHCGQCSEAVKIVNCTIYKDTNGLKLNGECVTCGQIVTRVVEIN